MSEITARENWGSKIGFILSVSGSAIGLGNIWRFPFITGMNGGAAFCLIYLLCILLVGLPIMICEFAIGRAAQKGPVSAFAKLFPGKSLLARYIAWLTLIYALILAGTGSHGLGVIFLLVALILFKWGFQATGAIALTAALIILTYYSVIGGWIIEYVRLAFFGKFSELQTVEDAQAHFVKFLGTPWQVILYHLVFLGIAAAMLWGGIKGGIERWSKVLMPMLLFLLLLVIARSVTLEGASKGLRFLFVPDFSKLNSGSVIAALGHSFYSLSLGMAISITYGSYQKKTDNLFSSALWVILLDTGAALLAGLAIFPAVFAMNLEPAAGPGLIFQILPATFNQIPLGWLWAGLFFIMLTIAAMTSAASLLECGITFLLDHTKLTRKPAILLTYLVIGAGGILACVSVLDWSRLEWLHTALCKAFGDGAYGGDWLDFLDGITNNWMITSAGLLTALFAAWVWTTRKATEELQQGAEKIAHTNLFQLMAGLKDTAPYSKLPQGIGITPCSAWCFAIRFISPIAILLIILSALGLFG